MHILQIIYKICGQWDINLSALVSDTHAWLSTNKRWFDSRVTLVLRCNDRDKNYNNQVIN